MQQFLSGIARKFWPDFDSLSAHDRLALLQELFGVLVGLPFVIASVVWLLVATNLAVLQEQWPVLLLLIGLSVLAGRLSFFQIDINPDGSYDYNGSSLEIVIVMSGMFLFGPTAVWVPFLGRLIDAYFDRPRSPSRHQRASRYRNLVFNLGPSIFGLLLVVWLYQQLGGRYPLADLTPATVWPAFVAILLWLPWEPLYIFVLGALTFKFDLMASVYQQRYFAFIKFLLLVNTPAFFGILAAAVYVHLGLLGFLFLISGLLLTSLLARRLSQQALLGQQRSREVGELERLARAIIAAPIDASGLPEVLANHIPRMFGYRHLEIRLFPGETLLLMPEDAAPAGKEMWDWFAAHPQPHAFNPGEILPWMGTAATRPHYLVPILATEESRPIGGIYIDLARIYHQETTLDLVPALQIMAAQIASALHQAENQAQILAHQKTVQELDFAWQIQASFLPDTLPQAAGWRVEAALNPCKVTSGDFYDVIDLPDGRLGILVADVADKGLGAALFMALSRTLIRTYAFEFQTRPEMVLQATNQRILTDTRSDMFVTVFYGILDPTTGRLEYANAGHNPPYLFPAPAADPAAPVPAPQALARTGIPLGILEDAAWQSRAIDLTRGSTLILYTDGITEAQNHQEELFGEQRLWSVTRDNLKAPVSTLQDALLTAVARFSAGGTQCDDETLLILKRH